MWFKASEAKVGIEQENWPFAKITTPVLPLYHQRRTVS